MPEEPDAAFKSWEMQQNSTTDIGHRYVIINDCDAPEPNMVCQWVPGVGYCYLNRSGTKPSHDGMLGREATPIEAFGFVWTDNSDGTVSFYLADDPPLPVTATYRDGTPRRWQSRAASFEFKQIKPDQSGKP